MITSKVSATHMNGELRAAKSRLDSGRLKSRLEGWDMAFKARGTSPRNAVCHDTGFVEELSGEREMFMSVACEWDALASWDGFIPCTDGGKFPAMTRVHERIIGDAIYRTLGLVLCDSKEEGDEVV